MSSQYVIDHFLTKAQRETLSSLSDVTLKKIISSKLNTISMKRSVEIAKATLNLLQKTPSSSIRDRFFVQFLKGPKEAVVHAQVQNIMTIVDSGFFNDFLLNIDTNKREYHTPEELVKMIDQFTHHTVPALIRDFAGVAGSSSNPLVPMPRAPVPTSSSNPAYEDRDNSALPQTASLSLMESVFQELKQCEMYHRLTLIFDKYTNAAREQKTLYAKVKEMIFDKIEDHSICSFDDREKVLLAKIAAFIIAPGNTGVDLCFAENTIRILITYASEIKKNAGDEVLSSVCKSYLKTNDLKLDCFIGAMKMLISASASEEGFYTSYRHWRNNKFEWNVLFDIFSHLTAEDTLNELSNDDIDERLLRFKNDPTVKNPLSDVHIEIIKGQYLLVDQYCKEYQSLEFQELISLAHEIRQHYNTNTIEENDRLKLIAIGRLAIKSYFGIYPYSTQILTLLGTLLENKSWQAQVKTGEGKSTIVTHLAFVMAMECRTIDIITSARSLAIRDQKKSQEFFKLSGIVSSHICYDNQKPNHFKAQILFGPGFDFEFAWMKDFLYDSRLFAARLTQPFVNRNFERAIIDESDNLLVDSAHNSARLSFPAEVSYDWVYAPILKYVSSLKNTNRNAQVIKDIRDILSADGHEERVAKLSDKQIEKWIISAMKALHHSKFETDYVVKEEVDKKGISRREIQIVDIETGRISKDSRWSEGIHEFLEVKHDIVVKKETIMPISLSHCVFYQFYPNITALTGTAELYQTNDIYGIDSFDVPPHKPLKRIDHPPIIVDRKELHFPAIYHAINIMRESRRPVLVLCETIRESMQLSKMLHQANVPNVTLNEMQEEEEDKIIAAAGVAGQVTIATNTAGRGTDILLPPESLENGGLSVLLTYYPDSERVYYQAVGRAGRQGQPGSSQMILCKEIELSKWLGIKDVNISNEELMHILPLKRVIKEKKMAHTHSRLAILERYLATKTELFFESFRIWSNAVVQDQFYEKLSQALFTIKVSPEKAFDFSQLTELDLNLAQKGRLLLINSNKEPLCWKLYIQSVVERLQKKLIASWTQTFYKKHVEQLHSNLDDIELIKTQIDADYEDCRQHWEKYFILDGSGVLTYLQEILSIDFLSILRRLKRF